MDPISRIQALYNDIPEKQYVGPRKCKCSINGKCNKKLGNCDGYKHCKRKVVY